MHLYITYVYHETFLFQLFCILCSLFWFSFYICLKVYTVLFSFSCILCIFSCYLLSCILCIFLSDVFFMPFLCNVHLRSYAFLFFVTFILHFMHFFNVTIILHFMHFYVISYVIILIFLGKLYLVLWLFRYISNISRYLSFWAQRPL